MKSPLWPSQSASFRESSRKSVGSSESESEREDCVDWRYCDQETMLGSPVAIVTCPEETGEAAGILSLYGNSFLEDSVGGSSGREKLAAICADSHCGFGGNLWICKLFIYENSCSPFGIH